MGNDFGYLGTGDSFVAAIILYYVVTFEILRDLPVIVGGLSGMLFEKTDKVLGIFKS